MEGRTVIDDRQTRMLDHLLSRHGESGPLIDELITNARWLGSLKKTSILVKRILLLVLLLPSLALAWNNGQSGNARTNLPSECSDPPFSTHDWVAAQALEMLPAEERAWLNPHSAMYLLGTEAPDNSSILASCGSPHTGYGDTGQGHSVDWNNEHTGWALRDTGELQDRAARRAQEEYNLAVIAFQQGNASDAAFFLGAMAHPGCDRRRSRVVLCSL